jgi:hypothetical protein
MPVRGCEAQAEGDNQHQPEPHPVERDRAQHDDDSRRTRNHAPEDPEPEQPLPGDGFAVQPGDIACVYDIGEQDDAPRPGALSLPQPLHRELRRWLEYPEWPHASAAGRACDD